PQTLCPMNSSAWRGILLISLSWLALARGLEAAVTATRLRCEYRVDPEGIGEKTPRLSWVLEADAGARGVRQTAYEILVASTPDRLARGEGDRWSSGKVMSDRMQQVVYAGAPLASRQACWWKVRAWDQADVAGPWSEPARWSIGLLAADDWRAQWIGLDAERPTDGSTLDHAVRDRLAKQPWIYADVEPAKTEPVTAFIRGLVTVPEGR